MGYASHTTRHASTRYSSWISGTGLSTRPMWRRAGLSNRSLDITESTWHWTRHGVFVTALRIPRGMIPRGTRAGLQARASPHVPCGVELACPIDLSISRRVGTHPASQPTKVRTLQPKDLVSWLVLVQVRIHRMSPLCLHRIPWLLHASHATSSRPARSLDASELSMGLSQLASQPTKVHGIIGCRLHVIIELRGREPIR